MVKIYRDNSTNQMVVEGISKLLPENYEVTYTATHVRVHNKARGKYDVEIPWSQIEDELGGTFASFQDVKDYLTDGGSPVAAPSPGSSDKYFTYNSGSPLTTHNINHNLGKVPSIRCFLSSGDEIMGDVQFVDLDNITVVFSTPTLITAYLN